MKHFKGEIIQVYDGDFIGWTTAELTEFINECGGYERWRMRTKEGSELVRLVGFDERHREKPTGKPLNLYRPIVFKKSKSAKYEEGTLVVNYTGEFVLDKDNGRINQVYKYKSNWF